MRPFTRTLTNLQDNGAKFRFFVTNIRFSFDSPSYTFKRSYSWDEVPMFNARINQAIDHGCNLNDGEILYSVLGIVLQREASSAVAICCFGPQKSAFISNLTDRTVIDVTQLRCPQFPTISCTFACHKSKQACALQSFYSIAQCLHSHILCLQYTRCLLQPTSH